MAIYLSSLIGSPSIGVYSLATEKVLIVPNSVPTKKAERLSRWLKVHLVHTTIGGTILAGALVYANSNGVLLPSFVREEELQSIRCGFDGNITVMETRKTAYGNLVLANDYGAIVDPRLRVPRCKRYLRLCALRRFQAKLPDCPTLAPWLWPRTKAS